MFKKNSDDNISHPDSNAASESSIIMIENESEGEKEDEIHIKNYSDDEGANNMFYQKIVSEAEEQEEKSHEDIKLEMKEYMEDLKDEGEEEFAHHYISQSSESNQYSSKNEMIQDELQDLSFKSYTNKFGI